MKNNNLLQQQQQQPKHHFLLFIVLSVLIGCSGYYHWCHFDRFIVNFIPQKQQSPPWLVYNDFDLFRTIEQEQQEQKRRQLQGPIASSATTTTTTTATEAPQLNNIDEDETESLTLMVSFQDIYKSVLFIGAIWGLGQGCAYFGLPALVGEIVAGFLLGPPLAKFVPFSSAFVLLGNFGLIGLILESGIDIDVAQLKEVGKRAVIMAFVGTTLPLGLGLGLGIAAAEDVKEAFAIGAAFAPSSLGVSATVLQNGGVLNTPVGQLIVACSVFDDVLGLILLSILQVFNKEEPSLFDFVLPFLSSFGFLIILGYSSITWIPYVIESTILPYFEESRRELVAFCIMFTLLFIYMPLLDVCKASFLTGVFLAGLPFSQIHAVHSAFARNARQLLNWLLRIFFAATIGFQVPITKFGDAYVARWGVKFLLPILAKLPLGLFLPRFQSKELPEDFPYNPYYRDVLTASLALVCRGEFNVIIVAYSLANGLIQAELYSAIVLAILIAAVFAPLSLKLVIQHYNTKSREYLEQSHPIKRLNSSDGDDDDTSDGYRPLFLAIQARTPVHWELQETFRKELIKGGLIVIDQRSWHTLAHDACDFVHSLTHELGAEAIDITEIFAQDTKVHVRVPALVSSSSTRSSSERTKVITNGEQQPHLHPSVQSDAMFLKELQSDDHSLTMETSQEQQQQQQQQQEEKQQQPSHNEEVDNVNTESSSTDLEDGVVKKEEDNNLNEEEKKIFGRCKEIEDILRQCLKGDKPSDYVIRVQQWKAFEFSSSAAAKSTTTAAAGDGPPAEAGQKPAGGGAGSKRISRFYSFTSNDDADDDPSTATTTTATTTKKKKNKTSHQSGGDPLHQQCTLDADLWKDDIPIHIAMRSGCFQSLDVSGGYGAFNATQGWDEQTMFSSPGLKRHHRRAKTFDPAVLSTTSTAAATTTTTEAAAAMIHNIKEEDIETIEIHELLHGYVR